MQTKFENWLRETGKKETTAYNYAQAINRISNHYEENEKQKLNLYKLTSPEELNKYVAIYNKGGKYEDFGDRGNGTNRAAINSYKQFISNIENFQNEMIKERSSFSYEKDLQSSIINQIDILFPNYRIVEQEYEIEGKKIDILLAKDNELLVIELKKDEANYKVFGQISMYIGLLKERYPNNEIKGCIIANSIDDSLVAACKTNENISLKVYLTQIKLLNY
ncbi:hypothetical protein CAPN010_01320 [Capnocytophaga cynodegmi]|uniref:endonuclease NucS domain-containing protein n=1 Tax=Capnocytophaga cynodegmi TaxID=28189 RepID=UPI001EE1DEFA|nr:endonuclease NucS domain-containing protein [Capnocytophaga cynodegmi]GJQ05974.1 hypothetical protein CAPN010_01320 [Capnocytophaga cynodegmi]